jgi:hypothetical protein
MFFTYRQNNSGGHFLPPALYVIIEARNWQEADEIALDHIYFNGCDDGIDCPCCGDRWNGQWKGEVGDAVPSIYGKPIEQYLAEDKFHSQRWADRDGVPVARVYYLDGRRNDVFMQAARTIKACARKVKSGLKK